MAAYLQHFPFFRKQTPMRRVLGIVSIVGGLIAIVTIAVLLFVDGMAKSAVEKSATSALGVPTTVADMDVGVFSGKCEMSRVAVKNPQGFRAEHFLSIGSIRVAVSLMSLLEDTVVVPELAIAQVDMNLEQKSLTSSNYGVIIENAKRAGKPSESEPPGEAKKFVIRRLSMEGVAVHVSARLPAGGKTAKADLTIPRIELEDVGTAGKPVAISEIAVIVVRAILDEVVKRGGIEIPAGALSDLGKLLEELAGEIEVDTKKAVEEALEKAEKKIEDVLEGSGGTSKDPLAPKE
jgi:hypothetical protein